MQFFPNFGLTFLNYCKMAWNEVKVWQDKNFNANYSNIKPANPVFA